jgi:anthranilate/para-aminobenzoate synthase component II
MIRLRTTWFMPLKKFRAYRLMCSATMKLVWTKSKNTTKLCFRPGPGLPEESGLLLDIIKEYAPKKSMLGVCLGHQAIGEAFGGKLLNMNRVIHGMATTVKLTAKPVCSF